MRTRTIATLAFAAITAGCADQGYSVIATTATVIGVNLAQQPSNGGMDATLGYKRGEVAFVPTNRSKDGTSSSGSGAKDTTDVLMELHYSGIFSNNGDIYQRLAVGTEAVKTGGAAVMFAKKPDGTVDTGAVNAATAVMQMTPQSNVTRQPAASRGTSNEAIYGQAAAACNISNLAANMAGLTSDQVACAKRELKRRGIDVQ